MTPWTDKPGPIGDMLQQLALGLKEENDRQIKDALDRVRRDVEAATTQAGEAKADARDTGKAVAQRVSTEHFDEVVDRLVDNERFGLLVERVDRLEEGDAVALGKRLSELETYVGGYEEEVDATLEGITERLTALESKPKPRAKKTGVSTGKAT